MFGIDICLVSTFWAVPFRLDVAINVSTSKKCQYFWGVGFYGNNKCSRGERGVQEVST